MQWVLLLLLFFYFFSLITYKNRYLKIEFILNNFFVKK